VICQEVSWFEPDDDLELVQKTVNLPQEEGVLGASRSVLGCGYSHIFEGKNVSWMRWFVAKWNVVTLNTAKPVAGTPHTCVNMQLAKCGIKSSSFMQVQILPIFQNDVAGYQERIRGRFVLRTIGEIHPCWCQSDSSGIA
jgi:hypothetical protein